MALTQIKTTGRADDAVTEAKVANDAIGTAEMKAGTDGQIITYDASGNPTAVGPGTDGQVLTSTGAGSPPAFESIPAGVGGATGVDFNDDVKARFGTGNDIEIYHSSDQSYIKNSTGNLRIETDALRLRSKTDTENYIKADLNGAVELYHDNSIRLATTSAGIDVTGSVDLPDNGKLLCGDSDDLQIDHSGTNSQIYHNGTGHLYIATLGTSEDINHQSTGKMTFTTGGSERLRITDDGIKFNGDTAAANGLDDYEEGTFTPQFNSGSAASACYASGESYSTQVGVYRKIGHVVHFIIKIQVSSGTLKSGHLQINNLPFTSGDFSTYSTAGGASYGYTTGYFSDTANLPTIFVTPGNSVLQFFTTAGNNFNGTSLNAAAGRMDIFGHYFTS